MFAGGEVLICEHIFRTRSIMFRLLHLNDDEENHVHVMLLFFAIICIGSWHLSVFVPQENLKVKMD